MDDMNRVESCGRAPRIAPEAPGLVQALVAHVYGVELGEMRAPTRSHSRAALARQVAMYLCRVVFGMSVCEIALAFDRHRSTACYALHLVEDLRDDPELDRTLRYLESMVRATVASAS